MGHYDDRLRDAASGSSHPGDGALAPYEDTLQHIALLASRRDRINAAQLEAERQVIHRAACDFEAGRLDAEDLYAFYMRYKQHALPGFSRLWNERMPIGAQRIGGLLYQQRVRGERHRLPPDGAWRGEWPLSDGVTFAPARQSVVYVLFDAFNEPCYVGSTQDLRKRLQAHARDGKEFTRWMAHPCANRKAAYELETKLLGEYKPYLNKRAAA